jgi:hypothetical protein
MTSWLLLITSLPTENATVRMRAWRALKSSGAAVLRDGAYLMPDIGECHATLEAIASDVLEGGGTALVLPTQEPVGAGFIALFNRDAEFVALQTDIRAVRNELASHNAAESQKLVRKLRKSLAAVSAMDFFPNDISSQCETALEELERATALAMSPNEPAPVQGEIARRLVEHYQGRVWATRRRPWIDRLASAWLIRRFIDPNARILWLEKPENCPANALGFDFDGALFSHNGPLVTFEVLLESFGLEASGLSRLAALVHFLDVGGVQVPEALGIESVMTGLRESLKDDDVLLAAASTVFDGLLKAFTQESR